MASASRTYKLISLSILSHKLSLGPSIGREIPVIDIESSEEMSLRKLNGDKTVYDSLMVLTLKRVFGGDREYRFRLALYA